MDKEGINVKARALLRKYWGFDTFREGQADIIEKIMSGRDVFAVLPTGGGKSLCYQVPALLLEGVTLVISPLIALMQDQVQRLQQLGIDAICINSSYSGRQIDQAWTDIEFGRYKLVYMAPERVHSDTFRARADRLNISLVAIDEAHCISEWGLNFRPAYLRIPEIRSLLSTSVPFAAFTATATPLVQDDIRNHLELNSPYECIQGFDRPNLTWSIFSTPNKRSKVKDVFKGVKGVGIIYASTRKAVEDWGEWAEKMGESVSVYHGGMSPVRREREAAAWLEGERRVMVATNAFGMGIDKADVRFVIHVDMPAALEAYYQEAGRAGRDGQRSHAILLYREEDETIQQALIDDSHPSGKEMQAVYDGLCNLSQIPLGDFPEHPLPIHYASLEHLTGLRKPQIKAAVEQLARQEVCSYVPMMRQKAQLKFMQPVSVIRAFGKQVQNPEIARFVDALLRTVPVDAFAEWWDVSLVDIARKSGIEQTELGKHFDFLQSRELVMWLSPGSQQRVFLQSERVSRLLLDHSRLRTAKKRAQNRLKDIKRYIHSVTCRRQFILKYFGQSSPDRCGKCDICLGRHEAVVITPDDEPVLRQLLQAIEEGIQAEGWSSHLGISRSKVEGYTRWLLQEEYISATIEDTIFYGLTAKALHFLEEWKPQS